MDRVAARDEQSEQGVAALVVGGPLAVGRAQQDVPGRAERNLLHRFGEVACVDSVLSLAGREQGRLVDQVAQLGANQARCLGRDPIKVDVFREGNVLGVNLQDRCAASPIRPLNHDPSIETTGSQEGRV